MKVLISHRGVEVEPKNNEFVVKLPTYFESSINFADSPAQDVLNTSVNATLTKYLSLVNAAAGNVIVTLPDATENEGKELNVKKIDSTGHTVTVRTSEEQMIDGQSSLIINTQWTTLSILAHAGAWYII